MELLVVQVGRCGPIHRGRRHPRHLVNKLVEELQVSGVRVRTVEGRRGLVPLPLVLLERGLDRVEEKGQRRKKGWRGLRQGLRSKGREFGQVKGLVIKGWEHTV